MATNVELLGSYWTLAGGAQPHTDKDYSPFDFKDRVEAAARVGFKGMGIWHSDLANTLKKRSLKEMPLGQVENYFTATKHGFQVKPRIRRMISFAQMNLVESVYVGKLDVIFCMNVLMYFSDDMRIAILRRFYDALEPGGYFLLGHSETLSNVPMKFESIVLGDCRVYRKPVAAEARRAPALVEGSL